MRGRKAATGAMLAAALGLAACSNDGPARTNVPDSKVSVDDSQTRSVFENPDGYPNVVAFCDGTTRVYTTTDRKVLLVLDAVQCGGQGRGGMVWQPDQEATK